MMGGTLKTKKDLTALEITLEREPWMDQIPVDDMTDVQKAALADFEAKEKALAEEQDKYRKQLDAELKVLRSQVQDLTNQFEVLLKELHHQRFAHDAKYFCQELYCARLQLALLQSVEDSLVRDQAQMDVEKAAARLKQAQDKVDAFSTEVAAAKALQDERVRVEKEASSNQNFRQQLAQYALEEEVLKNLLQLFKTKGRKDGKGRNTTALDANTSAAVARASLAAQGKGDIDGLLQPLLHPYNPLDAASDPYLDIGISA